MLIRIQHARPTNKAASLFGVRVLQVDDDDDAHEVQRRLLEQSQQISVTAEVSIGEEAFKLLDFTKVDVVTTDLVLPGISGIEIIIRIKTNFPTV